MKKFLLAVMAAAFLGCSFTTQAKDFNIGEALIFYIPNRIIDAFDTFTVNVGIGPTIRAELMATQAIKVGGGIGYTFKAFKDFNRQYGIGVQDGYYWSLIAIGQEDMERKDTMGFVKPYYEEFRGVPTPNQQIYEFYQGKRDYWQIGGALGLLVEAEVYIHPVEIADFVAGFFFLDIRQDDLRSENFR